MNNAAVNRSMEAQDKWSTAMPKEALLVASGPESPSKGASIFKKQ